MPKSKSLKKISKAIAKANKKYTKNSEWQALDTALASLCGLLPNNQLSTVLPKAELFPIGESCIQEIYGWANSEDIPLCNGRAFKSKQWLG